MHTIDLKKINIHTDLVIDELDKNLIGSIFNYDREDDNGVILESIEVVSDDYKLRKGFYETVSFSDITDCDNYKCVLDMFSKALNNMLLRCNIKKDGVCLIIGLGNENSTCDALGPKTLNNVLVTKYLFDNFSVDDGYSPVCILKPGVFGITGIESFDMINGVISEVRPDYIITVDALATNSVDRLTKAIQITNTGIRPGSGVNNARDEISYKTLGINVISIGVPTVVDAATIVSDTFKYLDKKLSFSMENMNNPKLKFVPSSRVNYLNHDGELSNDEKENVFGLLGSLSDDELKSLFNEVLEPINYNLMVTPKEIDYTIDKISTLIGNGINKVLHSAFKSTN